MGHRASGPSDAGSPAQVEDPLSRIHREFREQCIRDGTYRPVTQEELEQGLARWQAECNRPARLVKRRRRKKAKKVGWGRYRKQDWSE